MPEPAGKRSKGRAGHKWRQARARVIRTETHCAKCGLPVDKQLAWPDPMSASVDHIVPIAQGGAELARANLTLMHLVCNQRKGSGDRTKTGWTPTSRDWTIA